MKTKILFLALAILGTSLVQAQQPSQKVKKDCEKTLHKKIRRNMRLVQFKDYIDEGQKSKLIITCFVNRDRVVEVSKIEGATEAFSNAIIETMENHQIKCDSELIGRVFRFRLTFVHYPGEL